MKKLLAISTITFLLMGCTKTSNPENLAGKIDMSRPVGYVVVNEAEKAKTIYIMTGQKIDSNDNNDQPTEDEENLPEEETENIEVNE